MANFRLSRGRAYLGGVALGFIALFWFPVIYIVSNLVTRGEVTSDQIVLLTLPGLFPAFGAWALFDWVRRVDAEAALNAPIAPRITAPTETVQLEIHRTSSLTVALAAAIILGSTALQAAIVILFIVGHMSSYGAQAGGIAFLLFDLSPAISGGLLGWSLLRRGRSAWSGSGAGLEGSERLARSALIWVAVALVLAQVMWSVVNTLLALAVWWGPLELNPGVLMLMAGPCLILLGIARRTTSAAFEMVPLRTASPAASPSEPAAH